MSLLSRAYPGDFAAQSALTVFIAVTLIAACGLAIAGLLRRRAAVVHCLLVWALAWILIAPLATLAASASGFSLISIPVEFRIPASSPRGAIQPSTPAPAADFSQSTARVEEPETNVPRSQKLPIATGPVLSVEAAVRSTADASHSTLSAALSSLPDSSLPPTGNTRPRSAAAIFIAIWLAGTLWMFGSLVRSYVRMRSIRRSWIALDPKTLLGGESIRDLLDDVQHRGGIDELPAIGLSSRISTPCVLGVVRPAVVLPESCLREISREQFADVLVHECAHVVRRDCLVVLLQRLASAIFWLNPAVLLLNRSLTRVREEVCDNYVLAGTDAVTYGETLLHFAKLARGARPIAASAGILHWRGRLERRIAGLVDKRRSMQTRAGYKVAIGALATFGCLCFVACDVSFSANQPSPPQDARAGDDPKSNVSSPSSQIQAPQPSDSRPARQTPKRDFSFRPDSVSSPPGQNNAGVELVKGRPHTVSLSKALRVKLQTVVARKPTRQPPLVLQGSTALNPSSIVRIRTFPATRLSNKIIEIGKFTEDSKHAAQGSPAEFIAYSTREIRAGDHVKKGQFLLAFYSSEVANVEHDLVDAAARLQLDEEILRTMGAKGQGVAEIERLTQQRNLQMDKNKMNRAIGNLRAWGIPQKTIDAAIDEGKNPPRDRGPHDPAKEADFGRVEIRSPIDGIIIERNAVVGDVTDDGVNLFQIANLEKLFVLANLPEDRVSELEALGPEHPWTIKTTRSLRGTFSDIGTVIDPNQHTVVIRGEVENEQGLLRGGQFVRVSIELPVPANVVEVPNECVVDDGRQAIVFIQNDPAKPEDFTMQRVGIAKRLEKTLFVYSGSPPEPFKQSLADEALRPKPLPEGARLVASGVGELKAILEKLEATSRPK